MMYQQKTMSYHHVFTKETLLLLEPLLDTSRRKFTVTDRRRIFVAVNETIDIDLQLNESLEQRAKDTTPGCIVSA
jgi:hypothetical protein